MYSLSGSSPGFQSWITVSSQASATPPQSNGVVGNRLKFRNVIPSSNKRCFIELKDELLIVSSGVQYV